MLDRLIIILCAACALSGCATETKESVSYRKMDSMVNETQESALDACRTSAKPRATSDSLTGRIEYNETISECMRAHGYEKK